MKKPPKLPQLLERKIYKTGQTRGADDDVIYQNRVSRSSTVLIPYHFWDHLVTSAPGQIFEGGYIALISPSDYFNSANITQELLCRGLSIGGNALVFYQRRDEWINYNPDLLNPNWSPAYNRITPLGGQYVARISATTSSDNGGKIIRGFNTTLSKGAGIRLFEYASNSTIIACRIQLESLFWLCGDSVDVACENGMTQSDATLRKEYSLNLSTYNNLLNTDTLKQERIINSNNRTICPLCLEELSAKGFFSRVKQAEGREVHDLTITQLNLFHISELRFGTYNHRPYNLGWGHHHCNVVVKDAGIIETLDWMYNIVNRNIIDGHFHPANKPI